VCHRRRRIASREALLNTKVLIGFGIIAGFGVACDEAPTRSLFGEDGFIPVPVSTEERQELSLLDVERRSLGAWSELPGPEGRWVSSLQYRPDGNDFGPFVVGLSDLFDFNPTITFYSLEGGDRWERLVSTDAFPQPSVPSWTDDLRWVFETRVADEVTVARPAYRRRPARSSRGSARGAYSRREGRSHSGCGSRAKTPGLFDGKGPNPPQNAPRARFSRTRGPGGPLTRALLHCLRAHTICA
jgi:hypothetical protein